MPRKLWICACSSDRALSLVAGRPELGGLSVQVLEALATLPGEKQAATKEKLVQTLSDRGELSKLVALLQPLGLVDVLLNFSFRTASPGYSTAVFSRWKSLVVSKGLHLDWRVAMLISGSHCT